VWTKFRKVSLYDYLCIAQISFLIKTENSLKDYRLDIKDTFAAKDIKNLNNKAHDLKIKIEKFIHFFILLNDPFEFMYKCITIDFVSQNAMTKK